MPEAGLCCYSCIYLGTECHERGLEYIYLSLVGNWRPLSASAPMMLLGEDLVVAEQPIAICFGGLDGLK